MFRKMYKLAKNRAPTRLMRSIESVQLFLLLETNKHFIY